MSMLDRSYVLTIVALSIGLTAAAQEKVPTPPTEVTPPAGNAATVNNQPITEAALFRSLRHVPTDKKSDARAEVLDFLIDNVLIDQYLQQQKVDVDPKDIEPRVKQVKDEITKQGKSFDKVMKDLVLTEDELRKEITAYLRWERFVEVKATDQVLREMHGKNPEVFSGAEVRARHILLTPATGDTSGEQAKTQLIAIKKKIDAEVATGLTKLPAGVDPQTREKERVRMLEEVFAAAAREQSACPSKAQGGDLGYFPRKDAMVEPFAKTAFALPAYQLSDPVQTKFGYHLILVTGRKTGKEMKYEEVKDIVKDMYAEQLRDTLLAQLRPTAKIVKTPATATK